MELSDPDDGRFGLKKFWFYYLQVLGSIKEQFVALYL